MTSEKILREILNTDATAATVRNDCRRLVENFDGHVKENQEKLRERLYEQADQELSRAQEREKRRADEQIEALDKKLLRDMAQAEERFQATKDSVIETIYRAAVGLDA